MGFNVRKVFEPFSPDERRKAYEMFVSWPVPDPQDGGENLRLSPEGLSCPIGACLVARGVNKPIISYGEVAEFIDAEPGQLLTLKMPDGTELDGGATLDFMYWWDTYAVEQPRAKAEQVLAKILFGRDGV